MQTSLPLTYRQELTQNIFHILRAGDSCSIVGASGTAKSNFFRHLLNPEVRQHYLGDAWQSYLFLAVDSHALGELSERAMYDLLLERLTAEIRERGLSGDLVATVEQLHQQALPSADPLDWQRAFAQAMRAVMTADASRHLVFLFDQFDEVYEKLNSRFFANLRAIRDQHKYRVSYVTFTRDVLPQISQAPERNEFYELLSPNVIGLGPYNEGDAWTLLRRVGWRYTVEPETTLGDHLIALTGGHPGILKAAFLAVHHQRVRLPRSNTDAIANLLEDTDVWTECDKVWTSVGSDEQSLLVDVALGRPLPDSSSEAFRLLMLKSLLVSGGQGIGIFSPLFREFVCRQGIACLGPIRVDKEAGKAFVGESLIEDLTKLEFDLLSFLYDNRGNVCSRDDIIVALYPHEVKDPDAELPDSRVDTLIGRLRKKIEPDPSRPRYIITIRGRGYMLVEEPP